MNSKSANVTSLVFLYQGLEGANAQKLTVSSSRTMYDNGTRVLCVFGVCLEKRRLYRTTGADSGKIDLLTLFCIKNLSTYSMSKKLRPAPFSWTILGGVNR